MPISRKKSCAQCRVAKTRCNLARTCSRCLQRGFRCYYEDDYSRQIHYSSQSEPLVDVRDVPLAQHPESMQIETQVSNNALPDCVEDIELTGTSHQEDLAALRVVDSSDGGISNWDVLDTVCSVPSPGFSGSLNVLEELLRQSPEPNMLAQPSWSGPDSNTQSLIRHSDTDEQNRSGMANQNEYIAETSKGHLATYAKRFHDVRSPKHPLAMQHFLTTQVIWSQIDTYPEMMIQGQLPPFIYPICCLQDQSTKACVTNGTHQCLPEPLAICANLLHLFYKRTPQSHSFVWRSIYAEQKRLKSVYQQYDSRSLLSSLQSTLIYMILQVQDAQSMQYSDIGLMISNFLDIAAKLHNSSNCDYISNMYKDKPPKLHEWGFNESMRRTFGLLYVFDSILEIKIDHHQFVNCLTFDHLPLPGPRLLWDYHRSETWVYRFEQFLSKGVLEKDLTIGDLRMSRRNLADVNLGEGTFGEISKWCEGIDDFGRLLWMVVLLD